MIQQTYDGLPLTLSEGALPISKSAHDPKLLDSGSSADDFDSPEIVVCFSSKGVVEWEGFTLHIWGL